MYLWQHGVLETESERTVQSNASDGLQQSIMYCAMSCTTDGCIYGALVDIMDPVMGYTGVEEEDTWTLISQYLANGQRT